MHPTYMYITTYLLIPFYIIFCYLYSLKSLLVYIIALFTLLLFINHVLIHTDND